jgi:hypothetical protein
LKFLNRNLDSIENVEEKEKTNLNPSKKTWLDWILFKSLFQKMNQSERRGLTFTGIILLLNAVLCGLFQIQVYLFFYLPFPNLNQIPFVSSFFQLFFTFLLGSVLVFFIAEILTRLLFDIKENWKGFLSLFGITYIPMILYLLFYIPLSFIPTFTESLWNNILMIAFQVWAMFLLSYAISLTKFIKFERGLIIAIFIDYGTFMYLLIARNLTF